jgi:hypothetical protein
MRGSIRAFVGFLMVFGAVGGMDTPDAALVTLVAIAVLGLAILASGVSAMRK